MALDSLDSFDESRLQDDCLSTGIRVLDEEILQGIPKGSTVAILGDPRGMAELFLYHLVHTDRPTQYVSTVRPARFVEEDIDALGTLPDGLTLQDTFGTSDKIPDILQTHSARLQENHNFVVDTLSTYYLKADSDELYLQTLRQVYNNVRASDALGYLYFTANDESDLNPAEREALHMCDAIFRVVTEGSGDELDTRLEIHKLRGRDFTDEYVKLNVGRMLSIDTTRDIA